MHRDAVNVAMYYKVKKLSELHMRNARTKQEDFI